MSRFKRLFGFALVMAPALATAQPTGASQSAWVIVDVGLVRVTPTRPGTDKPWDTPSVKPKGDPCDLLGVVTPVAGKSGVALCEMMSDSGTERSAHPETDPDLFVLLRASAHSSYRSYTAKNQGSHVFHFRTVVPLEAVPASGIELLVLNDDGMGDDETQETIGSFRLKRDDLAKAAQSGEVITLKDGGVDKLELTVSPALSEPVRTKQVLDVKSQFAQVTTGDLSAGQVLEFRARGQYRLGRFAATENGGAGPEEWKLNRDFSKAPVGAAVAVLGRKSVTQNIIVRECGAAVARTDGRVLVGVNDRQPGRDEGTLDFEVIYRNPTPAEWTSSKPEGTCQGVAASEAKADAWTSVAAQRLAAYFASPHGPLVAESIRRITHPTGSGGRLGKVSTGFKDGVVTVHIPVTWNGGLSGTTYTTTVAWQLGEKGHVTAAVEQDNATFKVARPNADQLNEYFRNQVFQAAFGNPNASQPTRPGTRR